MRARLAAVVLIAAGIVPVSGASPCAAAAAGEKHAAVLVQFGSGQTQEFCVAFTEAEDRAGFSGIDLLERTGLPVVFGGTSAAATVCRIGSDGCPDGKSCFCRCPVASAPSCRFWGYYTIGSSGAWRFQQVGATDRVVHDGDVDAWRFGNHNGDRGAPAPATFSALCAKAKQVAARGTVTKQPPKSPAGVVVAAGVFIGFTIGIALAMRRRRS